MKKPNILVPIVITAVLIGLLIIVLPLFSEYKNKNIAKETKIYKIKVDYPIVKQDQIDHTILAFINKQIRQFKKLAPPAADDPRHYKNDLNISYDKPYITDELVSLVFYVLIYDGGAHPVTTVHTMNFSQETGQKLKLADVVKVDKASLRRMIIRKLDEQIVEPDQKWIAKGVNQDKLERFTIRYNDITFYFGQYEVAPYAQGIQKVRFKLSDLN